MADFAFQSLNKQHWSNLEPVYEYMIKKGYDCVRGNNGKNIITSFYQTLRNMSLKDKKVFWMPHGCQVQRGYMPPSNDKPFTNDNITYLLPGEFHLWMFWYMSHCPASKNVIVGYPKGDYLINNRDKRKEFKEKITDKPLILRISRGKALNPQLEMLRPVISSPSLT